ncbi:MAG: tRNA pseudouridine(13) synthase TruD [Phycisphaerales bacterium]|nr:tRNA pseudouridine(13) synthase TruD [Phycisphaerales bacterium]
MRTEAPLPDLTADLPGAGGVIKQDNEDFRVEELPLYAPSGSGTHVYFGIEKDGLTTHAAIERIARTVGRHPREIGYAGLKDAHAVTRQTLSLEHIDPQRIADLDIAGLRVLWVNRHGNKLKLGHLRGNRFILRVREIGPEAAARAEAILVVLRRRGMPNYFGPQRFGARGDTGLIGKAAMLGDFEDAMRYVLGRPTPEDRGPVLAARRHFEAGEFEQASRLWFKASVPNAKACRDLAQRATAWRRAWMTLGPSLRKLYLNAYQARIFNLVVARRITELDRIHTGDIAWLHRNGACFRVEDATAEQPRCDTFELSPTGPLFGPRMTAAEGEPGRIESDVFASEGITPEVLLGNKDARVDGARRALRVSIGDAACAEDEDARGRFLQLTFDLPSGSYATCLTREVCKAGLNPMGNRVASDDD